MLLPIVVCNFFQSLCRHFFQKNGVTSATPFMHLFLVFLFLRKLLTDCLGADFFADLIDKIRK